MGSTAAAGSGRRSGSPGLPEAARASTSPTTPASPAAIEAAPQTQRAPDDVGEVARDDHPEREHGVRSSSSERRRRVPAARPARRAGRGARCRRRPRRCPAPEITTHAAATQTLGAIAARPMPERHQPERRRRRRSEARAGRSTELAWKAPNARPMPAQPISRPEPKLAGVEGAESRGASSATLTRGVREHGDVPGDQHGQERSRTHRQRRTRP